MIAAGIAALVLVSVLLAFHGWPTNAATGTVPRLIAATTSTQAPVPTLVIGRPATTRTATARRSARLRTAPVRRAHNAPSSAPIYSDLSKPQPPAAATPKPAPNPTKCSGTCLPVPVPTTPLPPQITQILDQGSKNANGLTQQLSDTVTTTTRTVGGVLNDVTKTVGKVLGGH